MNTEIVWELQNIKKYWTKYIFQPTIGFEAFPRNGLVSKIVSLICKVDQPLCNGALNFLFGHSENQRNNVSCNQKISKFWLYILYKCWLFSKSIVDNFTSLRLSFSEWCISQTIVSFWARNWIRIFRKIFYQVQKHGKTGGSRWFPFFEGSDTVINTLFIQRQTSRRPQCGKTDSAVE